MGLLKVEYGIAPINMISRTYKKVCAVFDIFFVIYGTKVVRRRSQTVASDCLS